MILQRDLMAAVARQRDSAVVLTTMGSRGDWAQVSGVPQRDLPVSGAMGKASSVALGLALAQPDVKVILFDGDGSLLMNLGALIAIANKAPGNLYHFVMENGVYATTGGQPVPGQGRFSLAKLALAAGYPAAFEFEDLEEFTTRAEDILSQRGPVFVCAKIVPEVEEESPGTTLPPGVLPMRQALKEVQKALGVEPG